MQKVILRYGVISGVLMGILIFASALAMHHAQSLENSEIYGFTGMALCMLLVYLGVRDYRDKHNHGVISFGQAFKVGGLIALISCVCYVIAWLLAYETLVPDFMEKYVEYTLNKMKSSGAAQAEIEKTASEMNYYKGLYANPLYRAGITFMEPLPVALVMSLLSAALLRKKA